MNIRLFQQNDTQFLSQLFLQTRTKSWSWLDASQWSLEDFENYTQDEIILVAEKDQSYLGFAAIYMPDNFLHHLFVAPEYQNLGVGSALLTAVEKYFKDICYLKCLCKNKQAQHFYLKHGWQIIGSGESADGDYFLMAKQLMIA